MESFIISELNTTICLSVAMSDEEILKAIETKQTSEIIGKKIVSVTTILPCKSYSQDDKGEIR